MKLIKMKIYTFLVFFTLLNISEIVTSQRYIDSNKAYMFTGTPKTLAIVAIVAAALQIISSVIYIIIPRKWSRGLFFTQILLILAFFFTSMGYFLEDVVFHLGISLSLSIFLSIEGFNGLFGIYMLYILGKEGWKDYYERQHDAEANDRVYHQQQNSLPNRFQFQQHPAQVQQQGPYAHPQMQQQGPYKQY